MTRSADRTSTTHVRRDDGVALELLSHAPLHRLPHDLAHFVVERALGLTSGFWGSIAKGSVFGGMKTVPRRRTGRVEKRSRQVMAHVGSQITEAEAVVGTVLEIYQRRLGRDWAAARALLGGTWRPSRPSRVLPTQAEVRRICEELSKAEDSWLNMAMGDSLTLRWPRNQSRLRVRSFPRATVAEHQHSVGALTRATDADRWPALAQLGGKDP
jgi:hypothetical protein